MATRSRLESLDEPSIAFKVTATQVIITGTQQDGTIYTKVRDIASLPAPLQTQLSDLRTQAINQIVSAWQAFEPSN